LELKKDKTYFPYPHKFHTTHAIIDLIKEYEIKCKENGQFKEEEVSIAGRIYAKRTSGRHLIFMDIFGDNSKIQILAHSKFYHCQNDFEKVREIIKRGDIVGVTGVVGRSQKGELSLKPTKLKLLSPCLHVLPKANLQKEVLKDQEIRYRQRYLDLICNPKPREIFVTRSKVISLIR